MKRVAGIVAKRDDEELRVSIEFTGDGSNYEADRIRNKFDDIVDLIHGAVNQKYYIKEISTKLP